MGDEEADGLGDELRFVGGFLKGGHDVLRGVEHVPLRHCALPSGSLAPAAPSGIFFCVLHNFD